MQALKMYRSQQLVSATRGEWYWYSVVCEDYLKEYGYYEPDVVDDEIEITAWMPLPEPYRESEEEE